jgi:hypothetical protein
MNANAAMIEQALKKKKVNDEDKPLYVIKDNKIGKNVEIWSKFGIVHHNREKMAFAACKECKAVYTFKPNTGTSTMSKHVCSKPPAESFAIKMYKQGQVTTGDKKKMTVAAAHFIYICIGGYGWVCMGGYGWVWVGMATELVGMGG